MKVARRRFNGRVRASVTVWTAWVLTFTMVMSLSLVEAVRVRTARTEVAISAFSAQRSLAGHYHNRLWEKWDLLALDMEKEREKLFSDYFRDGFSGSGNLFRVKEKNLSLVPYRLTDQGGQELVRQAVLSAKYRIPQDLWSKMKGGDKKRELQKLREETGRRKKNEPEPDIKKGMEKPPPGTQDPRKTVRPIRSEKGFFDYVTEGTEVSTKRGIRKVRLDGRHKPLGFDEIFYNEYILSHFKTAVSKKSSDRMLDYEVEYILKGSEKDSVNLKKVCSDIKWIRFVFNMAYLVKDKSKNTAAEAVAALLIGWTGMAPLVKLVKYGILGAWAYAESALDVKTLLKGDRVPWMKDAQSWVLGLNGLIRKGTDNRKKKTEGQTYDDYLRLLLYMQKNQTKTQRIFNLLETDLQKEGPVKMNRFAYGFESQLNYRVDMRYIRPVWMPKSFYEGEFKACYAYR